MVNYEVKYKADREFCWNAGLIGGIMGDATAYCGLIFGAYGALADKGSIGLCVVGAGIYTVGSAIRRFASMFVNAGAMTDISQSLESSRDAIQETVNTRVNGLEKKLDEVQKPQS